MVKVVWIVHIGSSKSPYLTVLLGFQNEFSLNKAVFQEPIRKGPLQAHRNLIKMKNLF